jgi:hypothetical protein
MWVELRRNPIGRISIRICKRTKSKKYPVDWIAVRVSRERNLSEFWMAQDDMLLIANELRKFVNPRTKVKIVDSLDRTSTYNRT